MVRILKFMLIVTVFSAPALTPAGVAHAQAQEAYEAFVEATKLAGAGAISRSIPRFEKAIELAPGQYPQAYFNLGEVYKAKKECRKAALVYQAYALYAGTEDAQKEAGRAMAPCKRADWGELVLTLEPEGARASVGGYLFPAGTNPKLTLPRGTYEIEVTAVDHHPAKTEIELSEGETDETIRLKEMEFSGKVRVDVEKGATVRIFEGPSDQTSVVAEFRAPGAEVEVSEGRHFIEVELDGYDRWIRNVSVRRDETSEVKVTLTPSKPQELR